MSSSSSPAGSSSSSSAADARHGVRLTRQASDPSSPVYAQRLVITADRPRNMPAEIFRYAKQALDPANPDDPNGYGYAFDGVCSAADLEQYAVGFAEVGTFPAYCRRAEVDAVFRAASLAADFWSKVVEEVSTLVRTLDTLTVLGPPEVVLFGTPAEA